MSNELIRTMFKHLVKTYSLDEARALLNAKFPASKDLIDSLTPEDFVEETRVQEAKTARVKADKVEKIKKVKVDKEPGEKKMELKKAVIMKIVQEMTGAKTKDIINKIMSDLTISQAYARNMFYVCKKELGL